MEATYKQRLLLYHLTKDKYWLEKDDISFGYAGKHISIFMQRPKKHCKSVAITEHG